ncbi:MAG: crosslink repair DNA glycosylase YcaQ family protein [Microbacterium sp.]|uniref:winged helix-turn-helix domain-containing protein n=1 Tax=Microbacterium sp. TaxID=51671 RepID=UPI0039E2D2E8
MRSRLSLPEARRVALAAQGVGRPVAIPVSSRAMRRELGRMGVLQIDSVNVFARSHYMPLFSRLGRYDTAQLDRMLFASRAPYVEVWAHQAAFVPAEDWALFAFRMAEHRERHARRVDPDTLRWVRDELASRGPLRPGEIETDAARAPRGPWWDWGAVKHALEHLWRCGEVAIAGRRGFERRYGLVTDVLPADVLSRPVPREEALRVLVLRAAQACGVATVADLDDYWRIGDQRTVREIVRDLAAAGTLVPVAVDGWREPAWLHAEARVPRRLTAATVLTPFDPVVWFRRRAERLFGFDYRIEIYTPAERRRFGYYSLPVLVDDALVGRVDLKADRSASVLRVQSAWWEPGRPAAAAERLAGVLREAAAWQGLAGVSISRWGDATGDLAAALPDAERHEHALAEAVALASEEPG